MCRRNYGFQLAGERHLVRRQPRCSGRGSVFNVGQGSFIAHWPVLAAGRHSTQLPRTGSQSQPLALLAGVVLIVAGIRVPSGGGGGRTGGGRGTRAPPPPRWSPPPGPPPPPAHTSPRPGAT